MKQLVASNIRRSILTAEVFRLRAVYRIWGIEAVAHAIRGMREPLPALKAFGARIGPGTRIYPGVTVHAARCDFSNLRIGSGVRIVRDCLLDLTDPIEIWDDAIVSFRCNLVTHQNVARSPLAQSGYGPTSAPIIIGRGAVLFTGVTVLMGVTVGECAMVAAGSVVLSDVAPRTLVGGVPARPLKNLQP